MAEAPRRIVIGFQGGGALSLKLSPDKLDALRQAIEEGKDRWHRVEATDGEVLLNLGEVVYLRVESDEHRVGF